MEKQRIQWIKCCDPFDGTPRYSFEGRDPSVTVSAIGVVITAERRRKYAHDPKSSKLFYTGYVCHREKESADYTKEYEHLKDCKAATEALFQVYCQAYPDDTKAY